MEKPAARPQVSVYDPTTGKPTSQKAIPEVFLTPIRPDLILEIHTGMAKNKRQPYAVHSQHGTKGTAAGHKVSAKSWGTGRAVSRIPRVKGSGTHRSGQGAIGNMCRGGHMFAPTKVWRKWHQRVNRRQRQVATSSALAASALPSLVSARGHKIDKTPELPLVVADTAESLKHTSEAVNLLKTVGAYSDVARVGGKRKLRAGRGKMRGRRFVKKKGPLVVYKNDAGIVRAFRNVPGVDLCSVDRLNLLQLAPGAHPGRFVIWTESAFSSLEKIFGSFAERSEVKSNFVLPRYNILSNTDIARVINSDEVQSVLNAKKPNNNMTKHLKHNPLKKKNAKYLEELNPHAAKVAKQKMTE